MSIAQDLAHALHRFNAKERNFLMRFALLGEVDSGPPTQSTNWVNSNFFLALKSVLEGADSEPIVLSDAAHCVYAAMDYHLDWLHAALWCLKGGWERKRDGAFVPVPRNPINADGTIQSGPHQQDVMGNQEDLDLLLVIEDVGITHLVLVEAKGVSSFGESQLKSKLKRLDLILGKDKAHQGNGLLVSMVLLAPIRKSDVGAKTLDITGKRAPAMAKALEMVRKHAPSIISDRIYPMEMPNFPAERFVVTRCNGSGENPKGSKRETRQTDLTHWKIKYPKSKVDGT